MIKQKDLLGLRHISTDEIDEILTASLPMKDIIMRDVKKVPALRGKSMATLFFENSTRTKSSFEIAAKYLSADCTNLAVSTSSVAKGETLIDTAKTLEVMGIELFVMRHGASGAPHFLGKHTNARIINAGDGMNEHPTQGLLDMFTMKTHKGNLGDLTVTIMGDVSHSRVARSNIWGLVKYGTNVRVVAPETLIPKELQKMGVQVYTDVEAALKGADVVNVLRLQKERQSAGLLPSLEEYNRFWGLTRKRVDLLKPDAIIMHPGPMNRGVEIMPDVYDMERCVVDEQVTNGVAVRMALLFMMLGGKVSDETN